MLLRVNSFTEGPHGRGACLTQAFPGACTGQGWGVEPGEGYVPGHVLVTVCSERVASWTCRGARSQGLCALLSSLSSVVGRVEEERNRMRQC